MLVCNRMTRRIVALNLTDSIERARALMVRHELRHLPVVRGGRLVGIISDRDLRGVAATAKTAQDVMTLNPIAIAPDAPVDEAARVMHAHKISALPVIEGGRVVGILTTTGILRAFVDLCGTAEPTTRMILTPQDRRAGERQVRQVVHDCNGELKWIHRKGQQLHLRLKARDIDGIATGLEAAGFDVTAVIASPQEEAEAAAPASPRRQARRRRDQGSASG